MKQIPHNLEAEQAILSAILYDNNILNEITGILNIEDFYSQAHQKIYSAILELARSLGLEAIPEAGSGLNEAVEEVTNWCISHGAASVLILPSDLPLIEAEDVARLVMIGSVRNSVAISPSGDGGTNALMRNPPDVIPPRFGPNSFGRHIEEALNRGVVVNFYRSPRLALDIDSEEDLRELMKYPNESVTRRLLEELGYVEKTSP